MMFAKLLKYELKSTYRTFLIIFAVVLISSLMPFFGGIVNSSNISLFGYTVLAILVMPVIIIYIVVVINRYNQNLYGEEAYLMFTLPVKSWQIILSKLISSVIWAILTALMAVISAAMLFLSAIITKQFPVSWDNLLYGLNYMNTPTTWKILLAIFVAGICFVMTIYLSITLSNLSIIRKGNAAFAVFFYFALGFIQTKLMNLFSFQSDLKSYYASYDAFNHYIGNNLIMYIGLQLVLIAVMFYITVYITSKKIHIR